MKNAIIMTVGTGIGGGAESLAESLAGSILNKNPDKVYFICTEESIRTVDLIRKHLKPNLEIENVVLDNCDDFDSVLKKMRSELCKVRASYDQVTVNYTSGTKTMSAAAVYAGIIEGVDWLEVNSGIRKDGTVKKGTEKVNSYRTKILLSEIDLRKKSAPLFNMHLYCHVKRLLEEVKEEIAFDNIDALIGVANAYDCWDKFMHNDALEHLKKSADCLKQSFSKTDLYKMLCRNRGFLERLRNSGECEKYVYLIADLLNNAERRGEESKFDDAVARLYRAIEMLAEYKLRKLGIMLDKIDECNLPVQIRDKWKDKIKEGRMEIALKEKYALLKDLRDPLGEKYEDRQLKDLLKKRNYSILAHGHEHVVQDDYQKLLEKVKMIARDEISILERLQEDAKFPSLKDDDLLTIIGIRCPKQS